MLRSDNERAWRSSGGAGEERDEEDGEELRLEEVVIIIGWVRLAVLGVCVRWGREKVCGRASSVYIVFLFNVDDDVNKQ